MADERFDRLMEMQERQQEQAMMRETLNMTRRKGEQEEDTRPKRVKVAPREPIDRALDVQESMENAYTVKMTPLPTTNNRPSVIGFSTSGPRNQGIILTQKTKPPQEFGIEWGVHDTTSNTINQAAEVFAPVRETSQVSPEAVRNNLEDLSGALQKVRSSPRRGETEHLKTLEAVRLPKSDTQEYQSQKQKFAPFLDEIAPREHEQNSKRPKRGVATPPSANTHHPKMLSDPSPHIDTRKADHDLMRQNLGEIFMKAQADRERTSKAVAIRSVRKIKAQWEEQQKALKAGMAAALAACAE